MKKIFNCEKTISIDVERKILVQMLKKRWEWWIVDRQQISNSDEEQKSWFLEILKDWCYYDEVITIDVTNVVINC